MEIWKDIKGYEGTYEVSNKGNVRSKDRKVIYSNGKVVAYKGSDKIKCIDKYGYEYVSLYLSQKQKQGMVHRLVASAFIDNPENKQQVNHIDGNKTNNNVDNLEWCTALENLAHAVRTGLLDGVIGENHYRSKLTKKNVIDIRKRVKNGETYKAVADSFGVVKSTIGFIVNKKTWKSV